MDLPSLAGDARATRMYPSLVATHCDPLRVQLLNHLRQFVTVQLPSGLLLCVRLPCPPGQARRAFEGLSPD